MSRIPLVRLYLSVFCRQNLSSQVNVNEMISTNINWLVHFRLIKVYFYLAETHFSLMTSLIFFKIFDVKYNVWKCSNEFNDQVLSGCRIVTASDYRSVGQKIVFVTPVWNVRYVSCMVIVLSSMDVIWLFSRAAKFCRILLFDFCPSKLLLLISSWAITFAYALFPLNFVTH